MESVRIIEIPDCKMVSSGIGNFGEGKFKIFEEYFTSLPPTIFPHDFLFWDNGENGEGGFHWLYLYDKNMDVPGELSIIDFKGGLYSVVTAIDQQDNSEAMRVRDAYLESHNLEIDKSRPELGNIGTGPLGKSILGFEQMNYYTPIKKLTE